MRSSVEELARAKVFVPDEVWDANDDILVCQNGTLEISSDTLREHRPGDSTPSEPSLTSSTPATSGLETTVVLRSGSQAIQIVTTSYLMRTTRASPS
jgi:D5 N terminal like